MDIGETHFAPPRDPVHGSEKIKELRRALTSAELGDAFAKVATWAVLANFVVLFTRPQDWSGLSFFGTIRGPFVFSVIGLGFWAVRMKAAWNRITILMVVLIVCEGLRGLIGVFADPRNAIVVNDFWQFHIWKDLALQFFGFCFPLAVYMRYGRSYDRLCRLIVFVGVLLAAYTITHGGRGPGGFLGDENDICLVLVMFLPFAALMPLALRGAAFRLLCLVGVVLICAGIVITQSRGGFLGFAAVLIFFFLRSDRKLVTVTVLGLAMLIAFPFVPQKYLDEVRSIGDELTSGTGTIQQRLDTWEVAWRVFKDPPNFIAGVGLNNTPFHFGDYEDVGRGRVTRSLAGRAMHSVYFQLLPDLGLYGVFLVGWILWYTWRGNVQLGKRHTYALKALAAAAQQNGREDSDQDEPERRFDVESAKDEVGPMVRRLMSELSRVRLHARALTISLVGVMAAGIGVSVLYYPPIWSLACLSCALHRRSERLLAIASELQELLVAKAEGALRRSDDAALS